nr:hypothetical protein [Tanacetum cinerariifolium]
WESATRRPTPFAGGLRRTRAKVYVLPLYQSFPAKVEIVASGVFSGVVAEYMKVVMGGNSLVLTFCMGIGVEKPDDGVISLPLFMPEKYVKWFGGYLTWFRWDYSLRVPRMGPLIV